VQAVIGIAFTGLVTITVEETYSKPSGGEIINGVVNMVLLTLALGTLGFFHHRTVACAPPDAFGRLGRALNTLSVFLIALVSTSRVFGECRVIEEEEEEEEDGGDDDDDDYDDDDDDMMMMMMMMMTMMTMVILLHF
jgi:hypothetical protein